MNIHHSPFKTIQQLGHYSGSASTMTLSASMYNVKTTREDPRPQSDGVNVTPHNYENEENAIGNHSSLLGVKLPFTLTRFCSMFAYWKSQALPAAPWFLILGALEESVITCGEKIK
jgi:hypothetical protein